MIEEPLKQKELLLALYLIDYHRHAFSVRSRGLMTGIFDPPEVRELVNLVVWVGGGMKAEDKIAHMTGLHGIIINNAEEITELISRMREGNKTTRIIDRINQLNVELEAADALMGYISDG